MPSRWASCVNGEYQTAPTLAVYGVEEKVGESESREDAGVIERAEDAYPELADR